MKSSLSVASVSRLMPTPENPTSGVFVQRRLDAMAEIMAVRRFQPVPYFPILRPLPDWAVGSTAKSDVSGVNRLPMFYIPKLMKRLDSYWLCRSVDQALNQANAHRRLDLIDAHFGYPDGVGCVKAARQLGVPLVVTVRGVEEEQLTTPVIGTKIRNMLRSIDGLICVSHSLRKIMLTAGADGSRTTVIHNAVDRRMFAPGNQAAARQRLGVDADSPLIVSVGNLLKVKGHDTLIEAFAKAGGPVAQAKLIIIGAEMHEPGYAAQLASLCSEFGVADRVVFAGRRNPAEVQQWLIAADVFALASRREGCCNALLEALATGIPAVVTSVGDNPYFVTPDTNGFLISPENPEGLANALETALSRKCWDRSEISKSLQVGDWNSVAAQIETFFGRVLASRRSGKSLADSLIATSQRNP